MTTPLRDALQDAATRAEPALTFSPARALDTGLARRRRRHVVGATALTLAVVGTAAGVAVAAQSSESRTQSRLPAALPTAPLAPNEGPPCGTLDPQMAQIAKDELPPVGTWGPVTVGSGFCDADTRSFQVVIHIGDRVATLSASYFPTPNLRSTATPSTYCGPGYAGTPGQPNTPPPAPAGWTCQDRDTSEGHVHSYDDDASKDATAAPSYAPGETVLPVTGAAIGSAGAALTRENGSVIQAEARGDLDYGPSSTKPYGASPYTGAQLADLVVALSQQLDN